MFSFENKIVYIISPVKWGNMKVSKHHYAIELARYGAKVFYIEPPSKENNERIKIDKLADSINLWKLSYYPFARGRRFLPLYIYKILLKIQASKLVQFLGIKPDVVISFDPARFEDLRYFKGRYSVFFAGDLFNETPLPGEIMTADFCLGVSDTIVAQLKKHNKRSYFIHHGLNTYFTEYAKEQVKKTNHTRLNKSSLIAGFIGNLFMEALDREIMQKVICGNPDVQFVFWGMYERNQDTIVPYETDEVYAFINFLKESENVRLMGVKNQDQLIEEIKMVDLFWFCYNGSKNVLWDGSNSHKILEYLATGVPIVSHFVSTYNKSGLLYMQPTPSNETYPELFEYVKKIIKEGEDSSLIEKRLSFAIQNTYANKVIEIESLIDSHAFRK